MEGQNESDVSVFTECAVDNGRERTWLGMVVASATFTTPKHGAIVAGRCKLCIWLCKAREVEKPVPLL